MGLIRSVAVLAAFALAGAGTAMAQAGGRPPPPRTPHALAGKADCLSCHGPAANQHIKSVPAAHRFANTACVACHRLAATMPPGSAHAMDAAHATCAGCHVEGSPTHAKPVPTSHANRHESTCQLCHQPAAPPG
jgi:hypothetical protein